MVENQTVLRFLPISQMAYIDIGQNALLEKSRHLYIGL
jgi:hypothetical protein